MHALALELALAGGRFVRDQRPDKVLVSQTKETDLDVVTIMDTQCEALLRAMIREQRPDDAILGEEGMLSLEPLD
ncbi:inositol monophosphatase family protein [Ornithinimicrobium sp. INDO-MA30-4]|uniref:inositol monophosphatase family protein n=1 Tax=Ornithinimicrobium sp. INDO-MA30-4 TaxID=2908651 RepID=UPI0037CA6CA3